MTPPTAAQIRAFSDSEVEAAINVASHTFNVFLRLGLTDAMKELAPLAVNLATEVYRRQTAANEPQFTQPGPGVMQ